MSQDWEKGLDGWIPSSTHGHSDHMGEDAVRLARAFVPCWSPSSKIMYLNGKGGLEKFQPMNTGGTVDDGGVLYSMVPAFHSSAIMEDGKPVTMGDPASFVIRTGGHSIYHAGDTCLFSDMALVQRLYQPKVGFSRGGSLHHGTGTGRHRLQRVPRSRRCHSGSLGYLRPADRRSEGLPRPGHARPCRNPRTGRVHRGPEALARARGNHSSGVGNGLPVRA
ncbi:MAG: MBL fold metallo-hydrolase [Geminicoccaceae bacterium]